MFLSLAAQTTALMNTTNVFQWQAVRNAGVIDSTAWKNALLITIKFAKTLVSMIIMTVCPF